MDKKQGLKKKTKIKVLSGFLFLAVLIGLLFYVFSGKNHLVLKDIFNANITKEELRESLSSLGFKGYLCIGILSMFQVVLAFLPAEPVQVLSGVTFGLVRGGLACLAGVFIGNTIMYILYKVYGQSLSNYFETHAEFDFSVARRSNKIAMIIFILYFLPAIPYGLICLFTASLNIRYPKYIFLTTVGAIPSIIIGVGLGHMAIASSWILSVGVFVVLIALLVILYKNKSKVFKKVNAFMLKREKKSHELKKANGAFLALLAFGTKIIFDRKIKVRLKKQVKRLERPCIVLCNHGSALDFVYTGRMLRKEKPNFVSARLYFYHKRLGKLMRSVGCIPKSMFSSDLENAKGCLKALSDNRVLVMMPEARLSTVGVLEDIQESTYSFIKRSNVAVYTIKLCGDYFAKPKWGKGVRRGALLEAELKPLFKAGELKDMECSVMVEKINEALYYDEFKWLEAHPEIKYKSKVLAEGLENILSRCPKCNSLYTLNSKGHDITCSNCNMTATLDNRYAFVDKKPFENLKEWYNWQNQILKSEFSSPKFNISSKVELRHSSVDGKSFTRHAGEGVATLDAKGLTYVGTRDGEKIEKFFPLSNIYRLLFGAGEDFEIYEGKEIWYFVPEDKRMAVTFYSASVMLKEIYPD